MLSYIEYLGIPNTIAIALVIVFFVLQIIGELLEFKGKAVPEALKVRKYFVRKKDERETLKKIPGLVSDMKADMTNMSERFDEFTAHYKADNIDQRNDWILKVNQHLADSERKFGDIHKQLETTSEITLKILINNHRKEIIEFASYVADEKHPVTKEQFNRVFKLYDEYEKIISQHGLTNGEVTISHRIITEAYENHLKNHSFIEDIRGYEN